MTEETREELAAIGDLVVGVAVLGLLIGCVIALFA